MSGQEELQPIVRGCFRQIYNEFNQLESSGKAAKVIDRSVDYSTVADKIISDSIQTYFQSLPQSYSVLSEEQESSIDRDASRVVIADELDGTANLVSGGDLPFGPIIAIGTGPNPRFSDIEAMGFLSIPTGDLYEAYRDEGATLTSEWVQKSGDEQGLCTSGRKDITEESPPNILIDQYMLGDHAELAEKLWSLGYPGDFRSWAYHMTLVARGVYDLAITGDHCAINETKRATPEELAGGYLLINEAGGDIITWEGESLRSKRIGMADGATFDVAVGASRELAKEMLDILKFTGYE